MKNKKMLIIAGVAVLLLGGGAAFMMMKKPPPPPEEGEVVVEKSEPPGIMEMEPFLVNINNPQGDRYAKMKLKLTVVPASLAGDLAGDEVIQAKMRDRVLTLITAKSLEDLIGPMGKEGLRREIKAHLTPMLTEGKIQDVLFSEFVVQ